MSMPSYWVGAGPDFSGINNAYASQAQTNNYLAQQQAQMAQWNATAAAAARPTPPGYGQVNLPFLNMGSAKPAGTYSPGSGLSSFSGTSLGGGSGGSSVWNTGAAPFEHHGGVGGLQTFDPNKYLSQNKDVWEAGADPWQHYNQFGAKEGRQGAWGDFNSAGYLAANPDVAAAGVNPTAHWFQYGQKEGRQGSGFEPWFGASNQPAQQQPQQSQWAHTPDWDQYFNTATAPDADQGKNTLVAEYYLANPDVFKAAQQAGGDKTAFGLNHLMAFGQDEDRTFFDANKYRRDNPDVAAAGVDPTGHWFQFGQKEGRAAPMSSVFNKETYNLLNPDVAAAGMNPLQHWLTYGQKEHRLGGAFDTAGWDQFKGTTYRDPWEASIPQGRYSTDVASTVRALSQRYGWDPASMAAMVEMESKWNPQTATGQYRGMTQMGPQSFSDAGGKLGGLTWDQYQRATPAQQLATYGAWIDHYAKTSPNNAASLVKGGIGSLPPEMQAAIMQGTQFGPNATNWVQALGEGNMSMRTTPAPQASALGDTSINAMRNEMARLMMAWPQNQSPWPR